MKLPELSPCPVHELTPPKCIADCVICWSRFYFQFENDPIINRINKQRENYEAIVAQTKFTNLLESQGWITKENVLPPTGVFVKVINSKGNIFQDRVIETTWGKEWEKDQVFLAWKLNN